MNIDEFIGKYYPDTGKIRINELRKWLDWIDVLRGKENLREVLLCKDFIMRILTEFSSVSFSKTYYYRIKDYIVNLADYIGCNLSVPIPSLNEFIEQQNPDVYFKNLQEILDFIDKTGEQNLGTLYNPNIDLIHIKSLVILAWKGLNVDEISQLKPTNLCRINQECFLNMPTGKKIPLSENEFEILSKQTVISEYRALPGGKYVEYKTSDFLFRPTTKNKSDETQLTRERIYQLIIRFNETIKHGGKEIALPKLQENALFDELISDISKIPLTEKIRKYSDCTLTAALGIKIRFEKWKDKFYPEAATYTSADHIQLPSELSERWDALTISMLKEHPQFGTKILSDTLSLLQQLLKESDFPNAMALLKQQFDNKEYGSLVIKNLFTLIKDDNLPILQK